MRIRSLQLAAALAAVFLAGPVSARQHEHPSQPPQLSAADCARAQPMVDRIIAGAQQRLETARQTNNPAEMRAAIEHMDAALRDIRRQLEACGSGSLETHQSGHAHGATSPDPAAAARGKTRPADPHAGHGSSGHAGQHIDPVCGMTVDPRTAPSATYEGRTYHFCSERDRDEFLKQPRSYVKPPKH